MLGRLLGKLVSPNKRQWSVPEVRELLARNQLDAAQAAIDHLYDSTPRRELMASVLRAELAFRRGDDAAADAGFRAALREDPGLADAHYGLSLLLHEQGEHERAIQHAQFAKAADANDPRYLAQLGLCHLALGNYWSAESPLSQAVRSNDQDKASWNNLGIVRRAKGEPGEAYFCFERALAIDPGFANARDNLDRLKAELVAAGARPAAPAEAAAELTVASAGPAPVTSAPAGEPAVVPVDSQGAEADEDAGEPWAAEAHAAQLLLRDGRGEAALNAYEDLCLRWPDAPRLAARLARAYRKTGDSQSAIDVLNAYLARHPDNALVMAELGGAYLSAHENRQGEVWLRRAIDAGYEDVPTLSMMAHALHYQEKYDEAVAVFRRMRSEFADDSCRDQMAASLVMACHYQEALDLYEQLKAEGLSERVVGIGGYATALANLGRFEDALAQIDPMIEANPTDPQLHNQRAHILLLMGDFARGWDDYAYRGLGYSRNFRVLPLPVWRGEPLAGKSIIVLAEQGLGDQVMFASCLPDLLALGPRRVIVEAIHRVAPTLARSFPEVEVIATRQNRNLDWMRELGDVDCFVPLGDLPQYFRRDLAAFPSRPYWRADPERVAYWAARLREAGPGPYIGVSWRGGTPFTRTVLRSMASTDLKAMTGRVRATWVNLQYGQVDADLARAREAGVQLAHWPESIADLDEFTALCTALDAVATVCNTTVHYAGAIGRPVWVMAPKVPEWRYGLSGRRMPWYERVQVIRQNDSGEWSPVLAQVGDELKAFLGA